MTLQEELRLHAALDSLLAAGVPKDRLILTAERIGISWEPAGQ